MFRLTCLLWHWYINFQQMLVKLHELSVILNDPIRCFLEQWTIRLFNWCFIQTCRLWYPHDATLHFLIDIIIKPGLQPVSISWSFLEWTTHEPLCVSSMHRSHANLLCITPTLVYVLPKQALYLLIVKNVKALTNSGSGQSSVNKIFLRKKLVTQQY